MSLISLRDVTLSFGHPPLLEDVQLHVEAGERICLVGRNGSGKTTLLKLLAGEISPDRGEVFRAAGLRVATMPQNIPDALAGTCLEVVSALAQQAGGEVAALAQVRANEMISRMGLTPEAPVAQMSGGQKRRVLLAQALALAPDVLLLDEPTNHLDLDAIVWLENFLLRFSGTLVFVTHDRMFLQRLATRIVDIDNGAVTSWPGRYDAYLEKKEAWLAQEAVHLEKFSKRLAAEEAWIRQGIQARRTRNEGRVRQLIQMRRQAMETRQRQGAVQMAVQEAGRASKRVVTASGACFGYDAQTPLIRDLNMVLYRGDRLGVIGPNGCGKTTLIRLLLGELSPQCGEVVRGDNTEVAYLDQARDTLDHDKTVMENLLPDGGDAVVVNGHSRHVFSWLKDFLFTPERARTPVWVLSGGERNRLLLAKLFLRPCNVLVLDEPTNDLDTETMELLEERIAEFGGTAIIVSHDRAFLNNTVTRTLAFEPDGRIETFVGGFDDWQAQRTPVAPAEAPPKKSPERSERAHAKDAVERPRKLTFNEKRELEGLPARIAEMEAEHAELEALLNEPSFFVDNAAEVARVTSRVGPLEDEILDAYARLEALQERPQ
ncbi:MAG: ATP-binding cassette domain-containing protein [Proteobacteria bacterium]|nr:ATP-binding cassette domain-containing protein [Pseudomonadota bacterium]